MRGQNKNSSFWDTTALRSERAKRVQEVLNLSALRPFFLIKLLLTAIYERKEI